MKPTGIYSGWLLGSLAVAWLGLVGAWWSTIPVHLPMRHPAEMAEPIGVSLKERAPEDLIAPPRRPALEDPLIQRGLAVYQEFECNNCHKIGAEGWKKRKGPVLDNIGGLVTAEQLKEKLWDPMAWFAEGYEKEYKKVVMPDNYPELMSEAERDALVVYLMTLRNPDRETPKPVYPSGG